MRSLQCSPPIQDNKNSSGQKNVESNPKQSPSSTDQTKTRKWCADRTRKDASECMMLSEKTASKQKIKIRRPAFETISKPVSPITSSQKSSTLSETVAAERVGNVIPSLVGTNSFSNVAEYDFVARSSQSSLSLLSHKSSEEKLHVVEMRNVQLVQPLHPLKEEPPVNIFSSRTIAESVMSEDCPMDIDEEVDEDAMMIDIKEVREQLKEEPDAICGELTSCISQKRQIAVPIRTVKKIICIVIDTNVFISNMKLLSNIQQTMKGLNCNFIFLVPWVVLQELDALKTKGTKDCSVGKQARAAVKYLNRELTNTSTYFRGQSISEAASCDGLRIECSDDRILQCCMQYAKKDYRVILLTNDQNLRNKAIVGNITACSHLGILDKVGCVINKLEEEKDTLKGNQGASSSSHIKEACKKVKDVQQNLPKKNLPSSAKPVVVECTEIWNNVESDMLKVLSNAVRTEMKAVFPSNWLSIVIKKPPWQFLKDVLECMKKHWIGVFGFVYPRRNIQWVEEMMSILRTPKASLTPWKVTEYIVAGMKLLMEMQNRPGYGHAVDDCLKKLVSYKEKCDLLNRDSVCLVSPSAKNTVSKVSSSSVIPARASTCVKPLEYKPSAVNIVTPRIQKAAKGCGNQHKNASAIPVNKKRPLEENSDTVYVPSKIATPASRHVPARITQEVKLKSTTLRKDTLVPSKTSASRDTHYSPAPEQNCRASQIHKPGISPTALTQNRSEEVISVLTPTQEHEVGLLFHGVWESINHLCGMLCDSLSVTHTVIYSKPPDIPPREESVNFLPLVFSTVFRLSKELRKVLTADPQAKDFKNTCTSLYNLLVKLFTQEDPAESKITLEMMCSFCASHANRRQLQAGLSQLNFYRMHLHMCATNVSLQVQPS